MDPIKNTAPVESKSQPLYATEFVELASIGLPLYPNNPALSSGKVEMRYMTAREEDIITSQSYLKQGIAIEKLLESLIVTPIKIDDLLLGDFYGLMIAARVLGYGKDYSFDLTCPQCGHEHNKTEDLTLLKDRQIDASLFDENGLASFYLPLARKNIKVRCLTRDLDKQIEAEIDKMVKIFPTKPRPELTTRLYYIIASVEGDTNPSTIRTLVDNLRSMDSLALREFIKKITPGIDASFDFTCGWEGCQYSAKVAIPLTENFFWPGANL